MIAEKEQAIRFETAAIFTEPPVQRTRRWIKPAIGAVLIAAVVAGVVEWRKSGAAAVPKFGTATVRRQTISKTISATGTLQALMTVQVGTQASGTISELDADYNSQVKKGQIIARLDPSQFQAQLAQANATYQSAQASVIASQANVDRSKAAETDAQASYERTQKLVQAGVAPAMNLPTALSTRDQATASTAQAVAQVNQSKAQLAQAKAAVDLAAVNVDHAVIRAPIDGVVVARNVDVGQTVAASLQAPTIFLIANDLTRMQVLANIDEADVGQLTAGKDATFTVDAFPTDVFHGKVSQVRLAPTTVQNVVTYTAVIDVSNADLKLKPGMTANVTVVVGESDNALTIPNAALRFRPEQPAGQGAGQTKQASGQGAAHKGTGNRGTSVWKVNGQQLTRVPVQLGLSDGVNTAVTADALQEGDVVATPLAQASAQQGGRGQQQAPRSMFPVSGGGGRGR